jgi:F-type H+-transporting ATPase subunit epsilon
MPSFQFELVSPEKLVFSGQVEQVDVPGSEGDFGVLAQHEPLLAMLRPGILTIYGGSGPERIVVTGGFAEVTPEALTVLADAAVPVADFDRAALGAEIERTREAVAASPEDRTRDKLAKRLDQLQVLQTSLGAGAPAAH